MTDKPPRIIYLDQNKWIELLKAEKAPADWPQQFAVLERLRAKMEAREIVLPLASTNIYETYKVGEASMSSRIREETELFTSTSLGRRDL